MRQTATPWPLQLAAAGLLALPLAVTAQAPTYRIAIPVATSTAQAQQAPDAQTMVGRLIELGYVPGRNLVIELRSTEGRPGRVPIVAAELVALRPDLIVVPTCGSMLNALRRATATIPILVAACTDDMVAAGIVASLARPGGNITGQQKLTPELSAKRLELLKDLAPRARRIAVLWDPDYASFDADWRALRSAARTLGMDLLPVEARTPAELDAAFASAVSQRVDALLTLSDPMTFAHGRRVAELAAQHRLPVVTPYRETADAGGLASYGPNVLAMLRRAGELADRILQGTRPADIAVEQPTRFELIVNLKTARTLGLVIPQALLLRADEVIQ